MRMPKDLLARLRQKPKHVKENIALGIAGGFTAIVAIVWLVTVPKSFIAGDEVKKEGPHAFSTLIDQMKEQLAGVKNALPESATSTLEQIETLQQQVNAGIPTATSSPAYEQPVKQKEAVIMVVKASTSTASSSQPSERE